MNNHISAQRDIEAIDSEISRSRFRIALRPDFEAAFHERVRESRTASFVRWHLVALVFNLACLPLDHLAGIAETGVLVRLGMVTPLFALAIMILLRGPRKLHGAAVVLPVAAFASAAIFLGFQVPSPDREKYLMASAMLLISANTIAPMSFLQALATSLLSLSALFAMIFAFSAVSADMLGLGAFMAGVALISVLARGNREREVRNAFLLNRKDEIRSAHLVALTKALAELAETDALTGLPNRRSLSKVLAETWRTARERNDWIGILMMDIDHFKMFNDIAGHDQGDRCLREVAHALQAEAERNGHYIARFGGEEFTAIVTGLEPEPAMEVAENLRRSIERLGLPHPGLGQDRVVTVSVGASVLVAVAQTSVEDVLAAADKALYEAKEAGRNRVAYANVVLRRGHDRRKREAASA